MEANPDSLGDESNYHDQASYYDSMNGSMRDHDVDYQSGDLEQRSPLREQDRFLPIANVAKIMKRAVPNNGKIAKDAKECVQECVSEFISFITSEAAERCQAEKRKTINGEDILCAMNALGFDSYVEPLKTFLVKYREISKLESTYLDDTGTSGAGMLMPSTVVSPPSCSVTPATPGNTVIFTPANLLSGTGAGATSTPTVVCNRQPQQQFTVVNGSSGAAGNTVTTILNAAGTEIKLPPGTSLATLGPSSSAAAGLSTAIILPISTHLTMVNGIPTTTISTSDPSTNVS